ncbi:MAG: RNA polymerase-associated protein RapA [Gammaproteobacteria bacterium]|nr:RNA polymerase-associated protein RapA [Gammaproteobacteria bacterium]
MKLGQFIPGQRWISNSELELGLGTITTVENRRVGLFFSGSGENRLYASEDAPLTRVRFSEGEQVKANEGWSLTITAITEDAGILTYHGLRDSDRGSGITTSLCESELSPSIQLNRPLERLFNAQFDSNALFTLRLQTHHQLQQLAHSPLYGLCGARMDLIPHQLYIAHEVARRYAPRVLLADEVGLGKTIEAGLIIHHQLLNQRAERVLVVVPEPLLHQWLVELLRRFNLHFTIFDASRFQTDPLEEEEVEPGNPFEEEQLVIVTVEFLLHHPRQRQQATAAGWDLLVVDEAHHLEWTPSGASDAYRAVETLAEATRGVLLLTATPEQLGKEGHFARLRLLDPDRFPDYQRFLDEEAGYQPIAAAVKQLLEQTPLSAVTLATIRRYLDSEPRLLQLLEQTLQGDLQARERLLEQLLDRHGTGRLLFRNRRITLQGFPPRQLHPYPLIADDGYGQTTEEESQPPLQQRLTPESLPRHGNDWWEHDPRLPWLVETVQRLRPEKLLLITAHAETAKTVSQLLSERHGIRSALFHEGQSIVERDRAAAYFADTVDGTRILICSEIGSEGRNFQFVRHLLLFDLPFNPDLLEQRIGRLDRIGQKNRVEIHLPFIRNSPQEWLYRWYHHGVDAFSHHSPAIQGVFTHLTPQLLPLLEKSRAEVEHDLRALIETTRYHHQQLQQQLQQGRDQLLEINSCRPEIGNRLRCEIREEEERDELTPYLELLFDALAIESEEHSPGCTIIRYSHENRGSPLPGLDEEGLTFTTRRALATTYEDLAFLSWEHPLITAAMEMVTSTEMGNSALTALKLPPHKAALRPGTLLVETLHKIESVAATKGLGRRLLPATTVHTLIDNHGRSHQSWLTPELILSSQQKVKVEIAAKVLTGFGREIRSLVARSEEIAAAKVPQQLELAQQRAEQLLQTEIDRLEALARVNPNIRREEIDFFRQQQQELLRAIAAANCRLDAVRVLIVASVKRHHLCFDYGSVIK